MKMKNIIIFIAVCLVCLAILFFNTKGNQPKKTLLVEFENGLVIEDTSIIMQTLKAYLSQTLNANTKLYYIEITQRNDTLLLTFMHAYRIFDYEKSGIIGSIKIEDKIIFLKTHFSRFLKLNIEHQSDRVKELFAKNDSLLSEYKGLVWQLQLPLYDPKSHFLEKELIKIKEPKLKTTIKFTPWLPPAERKKSPN